MTEIYSFTDYSFTKDEVNKEIMGEKLNFGGIHYHSTSGHIYNTDVKAARKLIANNK